MATVAAAPVELHTHVAAPVAPTLSKITRSSSAPRASAPSRGVSFPRRHFADACARSPLFIRAPYLTRLSHRRSSGGSCTLRFRSRRFPSFKTWTLSFVSNSSGALCLPSISCVLKTCFFHLRKTVELFLHVLHLLAGLQPMLVFLLCLTSHDPSPLDQYISAQVSAICSIFLLARPFLSAHSHVCRCTRKPFGCISSPHYSHFTKPGM